MHGPNILPMITSLAASSSRLVLTHATEDFEWQHNCGSVIKYIRRYGPFISNQGRVIRKPNPQLILTTLDNNELYVFAPYRYSVLLPHEGYGHGNII